ncbi:RNA polymerase sigma factor [Luteolibacter luteus]|uniref:RNA polymerase sigma factor n=1 Tax=Luteolibacter luteus TaxID=2728835 RepID=A0A858RN67_9BACT|nr:RNA polymerase sigma factor [Luteolibacter luteus]QJE97944.1 RNA polymerase sigma factor [Luteolibacter luteus]
MPEATIDTVREHLETLYRAESGRILATLIRLLGDFDRAEDAMQDAFAAALERWTQEGVPANPRAWLVSTGRFKAIDALRRRARFDAAQEKLAQELEEKLSAADVTAARAEENMGLEDDTLRLIFTCCHPALAQEARLALTLREVCGLKTEEIARACLMTAPALAQRIVRAKAKIRDARIPYQVPSPEELPERLATVLQVVYLVFNEGYSASSGDSLTRPDLSAEAIRLGRLLLDLLPEPEVMGLLALMLLQESRRAARATPDGELILLESQDRSLWNRAQITEGIALVEQALISRRFGPYSLQAAIAAVHSEAAEASATDWPQIVALYTVLARAEPSPVIELNRAVAIAMRDGPEAGLALINAIFSRGELTDYHLAHSVHADLCRRLGRHAEARLSYERALELTRQEPERRFLEKRLRELQ